jgi:hypothetical protein
MLGSVRGALGNQRPYRDQNPIDEINQINEINEIDEIISCLCTNVPL